MERWVEHHLDLYSQEQTVNDNLEEAIPRLPEIIELDAPPTEEELSEAIDEFARGKAPGNNNIPAEILKANKEPLLPQLHKLQSDLLVAGSKHSTRHEGCQNHHTLQEQSGH